MTDSRRARKNPRLEALLERLEIEIRLLDALLVATEEERMALAAGSMERILACTERKKNILCAHESLGVSREHIVQRIPGGEEVLAGRQTLRDFVDARAEGSLREDLLAALGRLRERGGRLNQINASNGVLMRRALDWTTRLRSALTGEPEGEPLYTRRGLYRPAAAGGTVLQERV